MLVLSRHKDESIIIGDNIVVTVIDIRGDKVRLGINVPTEIPVHRQEVHDAIKRQNLSTSRLENPYPPFTQAERLEADAAKARGTDFGKIPPLHAPKAS